MSDTDRLLELIEDGVVAHGGDLGGWTRRGDLGLQLFEGRVTLRAELRDHEPPRDGVVHIHVITTLHDHDDEALDACLVGLGGDRGKALAEAAVIWITCVAGPIKSFVDGRPVCMTCQAGVQGGDASAGYVEGDYGLTGLRATSDRRSRAGLTTGGSARPSTNPNLGFGSPRNRPPPAACTSPRRPSSQRARMAGDGSWRSTARNLASRRRLACRRRGARIRLPDAVRGFRVSTEYERERAARRARTHDASLRGAFFALRIGRRTVGRDGRAGV